MTGALLVLFVIMQVAAQLCFKYGSLKPQHHLLGFIVGNVFGASSIWLLILLYQRLNANLALALAIGLAFVCTQLALAWVFHSQLVVGQWLGILLITAGILCVCLMGR